MLLPLKRIRLKHWFAVTLLCVAPLTAEPPRGTAPRAASTDYSAHGVQDNVQIGASLLTHKELKKTLASDVNQCCVVVEVAFYPSKDNFVKISLDNFMLREPGMELGVRPSSADVLAARLEIYPTTPDREHTPGLSRSSDVGYERTNGTNPTGSNTTERTSSGGIYQRQSVGIGVPVGGNTPAPRQEGTTPQSNRRAIEAELTEKGLPQVDTWEPVAGYLYFSVPKKKKDGYELVYTMGDKKIVLPLK